MRRDLEIVHAYKKGVRNWHLCIQKDTWKEALSVDIETKILNDLDEIAI
jgi:hypothetical protein